MSASLTLDYPTAGDLAAQLDEHASKGAVLLRTATIPAGLDPFTPVTLFVKIGSKIKELKAEVLQTIPNLGVAVRLLEPAAAVELTGGATASRPATAPSVSSGPPSARAGGRVAQGPQVPRGMGPATWPIEKLRADWNTLTIADKVAVAKRGKRAARMLVLKQPDKKLHHHVLQNPEITPMEVAAMVGMANLEPALLQRITGSPEWVRHSDVARALVCHPKMAMPQITRLLHQLPDNELRRLSRTGRVRASVKRLIIRHLDSGGRRRRR